MLLLLLQFLEDQGLYESVDESSLREEVLGALDKLVKDWVKKVGRAAELADTFVADSNAKIFTFGSYRLGVHGPGAALLSDRIGCQVGLQRQATPPLNHFHLQELISIRSVWAQGTSAERMTFLV